MTVVRNEFERGENNTRSVLEERVAATAYLWHNYGKSTIGSREDIERVPIDRLAAFYREVLSAGQRRAGARGPVGRIEGPGDGCRYRRENSRAHASAGSNLYRGAAAGWRAFRGVAARGRRTRKCCWRITVQHRDIRTRRRCKCSSGIMTGGGAGAAVEARQGRLSKALVDTKKANSVTMSFGLEHDPGLIEVSANLSNGAVAGRSSQAADRHVGGRRRPSAQRRKSWIAPRPVCCAISTIR